MFSYNDYSNILEALKIVKREDTNPRDTFNLDNEYTVTTTFHIKDVRDNEDKSRDHLIDVPTLKRIMNKALKNGLKSQSGYGHLIMKNSIGKWDDFIISKQGKKITLVTVLLKNRKDPESYFTKPDDFKLIIESKHNLLDFTMIINDDK